MLYFGLQSNEGKNMKDADKIDWESLMKDTRKVDWLLDMAEKEVQCTWETGFELGRKSSSLLAVSLGLLGAITGYIMAQAAVNWPLFAMNFCVAAASILLALSFKARPYQGTGYTPSAILSGNLPTQDFTEARAGMLHEMERRIDMNAAANNKKSQLIGWSIIALIVSPFLAGAVLLCTAL